MCHLVVGLVGSVMSMIDVPLISACPVMEFIWGSSLLGRIVRLMATYSQFPFAASDRATNCSDWRPWKSL